MKVKKKEKNTKKKSFLARKRRRKFFSKNLFDVITRIFYDIVLYLLVFLGFVFIQRPKIKNMVWN